MDDDANCHEKHGFYLYHSILIYIMMIIPLFVTIIARQLLCCLKFLVLRFEDDNNH